MKRFLRFGRYGLLGIVNTILGYVMFVALSYTLHNQLLSSVVTEAVVQAFKYYGLGKFVFICESSRRPSPLTYLLGIMPGSFVIFVNVAIFSRFTPAWITGIIGLIVSFIYYKIFKRLYRAS